MPDPVTPVQIAVANVGVDNATSVQDVLNNPALMAILTQLLGPFLRQYGHSSAVGAFGGLIVWAFAHYGLVVSPELAEAMCIAGMVVTSYLWQAFSIWRGKANAPVQPVTPQT